MRFFCPLLGLVLRPTSSILLFVGALALAAASPAQAQSDGASDAFATARDHMERGQTYYLQGRFGEAAAEFEAAFAAQPFAAFLYNAGVSYENGGDLSRAIEFFRRYLLSSDMDVDDTATVEERIASLERRIRDRVAAAAASSGTSDTPPGGGTGDEPPPEGTAETVDAEGDPEGEGVPPEALPADFKSLVSVETVPAGATVTILRGEEVVATGTSPLSETLDGGEYRLRIEHPDFNPAETALSVDAGKVYLVQLNLSQGEFLGLLRVISSHPGSNVFIDDHDAGARGTTPFEAPVRAGTHHVWIERPGFVAVERDIEVTIGEDAVIDEDLERTDEGRVRVIGNIRGAQIFVDDDLVGAIPWEGEMHAGRHTLRIEADGMKPWEDRISVAPGQLTPVRAHLRAAMGRGGAVAAFVMTGVLLAGGIVSSVLAHDYALQLDNARRDGTLASNDSRVDLATGFSIAQWGAYGLSAILFGLSMYYLFYDDLPASEATVLVPRDYSLAPMIDVANETYGVVFGGRF